MDGMFRFSVCLMPVIFTLSQLQATNKSQLSSAKLSTLTTPTTTHNLTRSQTDKLQLSNSWVQSAAVTINCYIMLYHVRKYKHKLGIPRTDQIFKDLNKIWVKTIRLGKTFLFFYFFLLLTTYFGGECLFYTSLSPTQAQVSGPYIIISIESLNDNILATR